MTSNRLAMANALQGPDREFFAAIREGREPNSAVTQVLPCHQVLQRLEQLNAAAQ